MTRGSSPRPRGAFVAVPLFLVTVSTLNARDQARSWPVIRALRATANIIVPPDDTTDTPFVAIIRNLANVPVYRLECHNQAYDDTSTIDFSGTIQCALFALRDGRVVSWNLLAAANRDEESTDWWNRGRMRSDQLRADGPCAGYPEYQTVRHFRLRGMLVTLEYAGLEWSPAPIPDKPKLRRFTFTVTAAADKRATSRTAEVVHGAKPPRACY